MVQGHRKSLLLSYFSAQTLLIFLCQQHPAGAFHKNGSRPEHINHFCVCAPAVFCFDIGSHGLTLTFHSHKHTFTHTCSCMCTYSLPTHTHIHFLPYFHSRSLICFPAACFHKILFRFCRFLTTRTEILFLAVTFHCEMSTVFTFPPSGFRRFLHLQNHLTLHLLLSFLFFFLFFHQAD